MAREKENYRLNLERVLEAFPNEPELIPVKSVAEWLGICQRTIVRRGEMKIKRIGNTNYVAKTEIARFLS